MANRKLPPPILEGTLPAFCNNTIKVPFQMNRSVSSLEYSGFSLKIKTISSNQYLGTLDAATEALDSNASVVTFIPSQNVGLASKLHDGQYYKVQLAYKDATGQPGYYSTVATIKCTTTPNVGIAGLKLTEINPHTYTYVGTYSQQGGDSSEKVYSYQFNLYDENDILIKTSGEQIHNSSSDSEIYASEDTYVINQDLIFGNVYYLEYVVTTNNKMKISSGKFRIGQQKTIKPEIEVEFDISLDYNNGCIRLGLIGKKDSAGVEKPSTGSFKILRASSEDNFTTWDEITKFVLFGEKPSRQLWNDYTIKQGVSYKYGLQQYNEFKLSSNRIESKAIYADFEHAFLFDGTRQLKIKYNPKVTSFKNTLLETKMDTIGSKHPFIFRNGNVNYKEFPISGLISYFVDDDFTFVNSSFLSNEEKTTFLTSENIADERNFKLEVLNWLTDGKPKLFKSPTEGNYIVRLMNVSLSPTDSVGRMLHTFSCTAYEIADYCHESLVEHNLLHVDEPTAKQLRWETIEFAKSGLAMEDNLLHYPAVTLHFEGMIPGDKIYINDGIARPGINSYATGYTVTIGTTGTYNVDLNKGVTVTDVRLLSTVDNPNVWNKIVQHQGSLTYGYYSKLTNYFDTLVDVSFIDTPLQQFIGEHNILEELEDIRTEVQNIYYMHFIIRDLLPLYEQGNLIDAYRFAWDKAKMGVDAQHLIDRFAELETIQTAINNEVQYSWQWYDKINQYNELTAIMCEEYPDLLEFHDAESLQHTFGPQDEVDAYVKDIVSKVDLENQEQLLADCTFLGQKIIADYNVNESLYYYTLDGMLTIDETILEKYHDKAYSYSTDAKGMYPLVPAEYAIYELQNVAENKYLDGKTLQRYETYDPIVQLNSERMTMDLDETLEYSVRCPDTMTYIKTGNGVIGEITYQKQILTYAMEIDKADNPHRDAQVISAKNDYQDSYEALQNLILNTDSSQEEILEAQAICDSYYAIYVSVLEQKLKEKEEQQGEIV